MSEIIKKSFDVCEYEKLEKWLNQMADDGLTVISTKNDCFFINCDGKYEFEQSKKGEFKIAMLLLDEKHTSTESKKQIEFIEETGAHFVGMFDKWAIFRKQSKYGEFKLLSDKPSQIKNITNIIKWITVKFALFLLFQLWLFSNTFSNHSSIPKDISFFKVFGIIMVSLLIAMIVLLTIVLVYYAVTIIKLLKKRKELKRQATLFE